MESFLTDITNSVYMDGLKAAGYGVGRGSASPGVIDPTSIANNTMLSDSAIQGMLQSDITSKLVTNVDANKLYGVYVQPNVAVNLGLGQGTTTGGVLGYHGAFGGKDAAGKAVTIRYAVIAYPGGTVKNSSLGTSANDQLTSVTSHELAEAVTDPDVNYAALGWYDRRYGEIGDITQNNPNALVLMDGFLVQQVSDKNDQMIVLPPNTPPVTPPPPSSLIATKSTLSASPVKYSRRSASTTITMVIEAASGTALPTGTVDLIYNGQVLATGTIQVVNGQAQVSWGIVFGSNGTYGFSAVYSGSSSFASSTSNTLNVVV